MTVPKAGPRWMAAGLIIFLSGGVAAQSPTSPAPSASSRLDAAARRQVVDSIARVLDAQYVDVEVARRAADRLQRRLRAGAYDGAADPFAFAQAVSRDLYEVAQDLHLRLAYEPNRQLPAGLMRVVVGGGGSSSGPRPAGGPSPSGPGMPMDGRSLEEVARSNFGFDRVERLTGNVGYVALNQFLPLAIARETAAAAMRFLENSDAIIVDLRGNRGGSPDLVAFLLSYFFEAEPRKLMASYNRPMNRTYELWTLAEVPGRRRPDVDLWVLTSDQSASAAEMFAYLTAEQQRAVLVGERTAGGGNGAAPVSVGHGLVLTVSHTRLLNSPGWEGTGVTPHVQVPADSALVVAHRMALERLVASAGDDRRRASLDAALRLVSATAYPVRLAPEELERYAGSYGTTTVAVANGALHAGSPSGRTTRLTPLGGHVFAAGEELRYRFETDPAGVVTALIVERAAGPASRLPRSTG